MGLRFFIWAGLQSKYRHSSFTYNKACELLQINRNPGVVVDIVEGYRVDGYVFSAKAFKADTTAYNVVLRLFCENGDMDMAEELMNEMGLSDFYPDMITCGSMERALELLGEIERGGGNCSPNVVTYTSVIQSFCEKGQTKEALEILDRMEAFGCAPNRVTVSSLINGFCMEGHVEKAYKAIDKVVAGGNVSYGDCYSSLILSFVKFQKLEEAEKLIRKMLATGVKPDSLASSILIRELCLEGRVLDGFYLFDEVEKFEFLTSIDSDLYSILLVELCQQSHLVEAAKLARLLPKKGIRLKASYIDSIAENLKKFENEELVKQLSMIGK
ncbi:pentatricopeptide repeat-containing protein [Quercus suber]|uniref:Pentatricopeptide repeat-containing protein n=1 Tax=Quercus suber TaxID=58331 RepID=A0AAW0L616_QUESU